MALALALKGAPQRVSSKSAREVKVRVAVRVRPLLPKEVDKETKCAFVTSGTKLELCHPQVDHEAISFEFDSCYNETSTQSKIFEEEIKPLLQYPFKGLHSSCFAHGPTGSGKTFTMQGTPNEPGIIPRSIEHLVNTIKKKNQSSSEYQFKLLLSYLEIYNEKVYDLVEPKETELIIREDQQRNIFIKDLSEIAVESMEHFQRIFATALENRSTAPTKLNARSSRSHAIVIAKIEKYQKVAPFRVVSVGKLHLVDLAGSEDNRRTENEGQRMKESQAINKSLFALATVVDALNQGIRPQYRNSKLTRMLQDSLGGNSHSCVVVNVSPCAKHYADIHTALKFGNKSRNIVNKVAVREASKPLASRPPLQRQNTKRKHESSENLSSKRQPSMIKRDRSQSKIRHQGKPQHSQNSEKDLEAWMEEKLESKMQAMFEQQQQNSLKMKLKEQKSREQQEHLATKNAVVAMTPNSKGIVLKGLLLAARAFSNSSETSLALAKYREALAVAQDPDHKRKIKMKIRDLATRLKEGNVPSLRLNLDEASEPKKAVKTSQGNIKHKRPSSMSVLKERNGRSIKRTKTIGKKPETVQRPNKSQDDDNENDPDWTPDADDEVELTRKEMNKKLSQKAAPAIDDATRLKLEETLLSALNGGNIKALMAYDGIGKKRAEQIIEHREDFGLFSKVEDLRKIGFGERLLQKVVNSDIKA